MPDPTHSAPERGHDSRAVWLVLAAIGSVQIGASLAKDIFDQVTPTTMTWLRLLLGTLLLLPWVRPSLRGRSWADWKVVAGYGGTLGFMNWSFYQAIDRIPLGLAVTVEFLGPLGVALATSRRRRDLVWAGLAGLGVALLGGLPNHVNPAGVVFAALAGAAWAGYIWASRATGAHWEGLDGLVVAGVIAVVLFVFLPWLDRGKVKSIRYRGPLFKFFLYSFAISFLALGYLGLQPPTPAYTLAARVFTVVYFAFFLLMPWYTSIDKTKPVPTRVTYHAH